MTIIEKAMKNAAARREARPVPPADLPPPEPESHPASEKMPVTRRSHGSGAPVARASYEGLRESGFLVDGDAEPALVSQLRHLKRSVLKCAFGPLAESRSNLVLVTSPLPGAGKTYLSANLGQILSIERDRSALLVDADNTRGTLTRALKLRERQGFFDWLHDPALRFEDLVLETEQPALRVLPTGRSYSDSLELLGSQRAVDVLAQMMAAAPNQLIVMDGPPLLATPDGAALAALAGQVLLVIEAGVTTEASVEQSLKLLDTDKPIGLVLNKIPNSRLLASAGAYYYYSYSPTGGDHDRAPAHG